VEALKGNPFPVLHTWPMWTERWTDELSPLTVSCFFFPPRRIRTSGLFSFSINLKLWILQIVGGTLGRWMSPYQGRYLRRKQHTEKTHTYVHPFLEWDENRRAYQDISHLRLQGRYDRPKQNLWASQIPSCHTYQFFV
jgi:hypothetical protein